MHLHCLGTVGYHPNEFRHTSCFFIPEANILLDAGTGLFRAAPLLKNEHVSVLLSHGHLDHVIGLTYFLELFITTPLRKVTVYGAHEKIEGLKNHLFSSTLFPVEPKIDWIPIEQSSKVESANVQWVPLDHPGGSYGYRLNFADRSIAYVTDTVSRLDSPYWQMVHGVDLLIHECNFRNAQKEFAIHTGHSWTSAVLEGAEQAKIKRLVISHFDPLMDRHEPLGDDVSHSHFSGELHLAKDGDVIEF